MKHTITQALIDDKAVKETDQLLSEHSNFLNEYVNLLLWWNKKINLISRGVSRETLREHVRHSLLISDTDSYKKAERIIDAGTGGGLPGLPLSLCFPQKDFVLNDIVSKKVLAVKQIAKKLKLNNVITLDNSIGEASIVSGDLIITKHAFKVYELIDLLGESEWESLVFLKGAEEAIEELKEIKMPLNAKIMKLKHRDLDTEFYKGKAIVEINRRNYE